MKYLNLVLKVIFLCFCISEIVFANWKTERENLEHVFILNEFRVFYSLKGKNAIFDKSDVNRNNVPDIVENIALQLDIANNLFKKILGFNSPFNSNRYKNNVKNIDIHILYLKYNGNSGDAVIKYNYKILKDNNKSLSIAISNKIKTENLTPLHELFHTYQNGYTMFKNRWLTEGTARWSEFIFKKRTGKQHNLPSNEKDIEKLLYQTYDAKYFWNRLLFLCSKDDKGFTISKKLKYKVYIGTDTKIIKDNTIFGYIFLRKVFENLEKIDKIAGKEKLLTKYKWKESEQKSFNNNKYILKALKNTIIENNCHISNNEVNNFVKAVNNYLNNTIDAKDLSNYIETIGIPYKKIYKDGEHIYSRNPWDMKFFNNKLYIGAGNSSNSHPSPNSGPVPIISYDLKEDNFSIESEVDDEQIDSFRILNNTLYIPGYDAVKNHRTGNFYSKSVDKNWEKYSNINNALHVFDIVSYEDKLIAAISTQKGAEVSVSSDNGKNWMNFLLGPLQRTYSLLKVNNKLYAIKQDLSKRKKSKLTKNQLDNYYIVAEYLDGSFSPRYDIGLTDLFPGVNSNKNTSIRISKSEEIASNSIYIASYNYINPFSVYIAKSFDKNTSNVKRIKIPEGFVPRDILVRDKIVYILCSKKSFKKSDIIVLKGDLNNITNPKVLFQFSAVTFARSFEEKNGEFYFSLGSDVYSKKYWKQEELVPQTGQILRLDYNRVKI